MERILKNPKNTRGLGSTKNAKLHLYSVVETGPVTSPGGLELVAVTQEHRLEARQNGDVVWTFLAGGRIPQAPLIVDDRLAIFPCHDGFIYAVDADQGNLVWRSLAAPDDSRMVAFGQMESRWSCFGIVEHDGHILTTAGRLTTYDRGIFAVAIDPATGRQAWRARLAAEPHLSDVFRKVQSKNDSPADSRGAQLWSGMWHRTGQGHNVPPQIIEGRLHIFGALSVDLADPQDDILAGRGYQP